MPSAVFLLLFSNSQLHPLDTLQEEEQKVYSVLQHHEDSGLLNIVRESNPTAEIINERLRYYSDRIALVHYSGHAGESAILLDDTKADASGIAYQLTESARSGVLKLVILNGCSTQRQVKQLLECGVPAVIATHAPVGDVSAKAFAVSFFHNVCEIGMSIKDAFFNALGPAQLSTGESLNIGNKKTRHLDFFDDNSESTELWELFCINDEAVDINPIPLPIETEVRAIPNELLNDCLFKVLDKEENIEIRSLVEIQKAGRHVSMAKKQNEIINALPFPVGTHLQKLLIPDESDNGYNNEYNKVSMRRVEQIAEVFHTTMELMGFAMLSQLWELRLKDKISMIPAALLQTIKSYFGLNLKDRSMFDYLPLIKSIREYFDSLEIPYFIDELAILRRINRNAHPFAIACGYLTYLRKQAVLNRLRKAEVSINCKRAEENLCIFFENTGFLHRYNLTSIKHIDILKYRHSAKAEFNHAVIRLMQASGKPENIYYKLNYYLDNPGVILLKGDLKPTGRPGHFTADNLEFLNLSPFVIDRNAFDVDTDLINIMFFEEFRKQERGNKRAYRFKNVRWPDNFKAHWEIPPSGESHEDRYKNRGRDKFEAILLEFDAFHAMFLNDNL